MKPALVNSVTSTITLSDAASSALSGFTSSLSTLVDDKKELIDVSLCALLSGGHVLLEDVPGVGKTTFIKAFAKLLGRDMNRVQFTSDLLPADIIGVEVFNPATREFEFHRGPVFTSILLADELNRASPRTQSALLEAMGEGHVTVERRTYPLPEVFMVFASQNPSGSIGAFDLPESQLDRFAAKLNIGYPSAKREIDILRSAKRDPLGELPEGILTQELLQELQSKVEAIFVSDRVAAYAKRIIDATRANDALRTGVSTRGGVIWLRMSKAMALLKGRDHLTPDDLKAMAVACISHRLVTNGAKDTKQIVADILSATTAP